MEWRLYIKNNFNIIFLFLLFLISPVLALPFLGYMFIKEKDRNKLLFYAMLICGSLAFLAFHTVPAESDDLYRHFQNMHILRYSSFKDIFKSSYTGVYLNTIVMYVCGKTGVYGLYPALYIFVGYFLILYNTIRVNLRKRKTLEIVLIILFVFFCVNFRDFISGLRNYFAFITCGYFILNEKCFSRDRRITYVAIGLMGFIHTSAFIVLAILLLSDIIKDRIGKRVVLVGMSMFLPISIVACKIILLIPMFQNSDLINKVHRYFTTPNIINVKVYLYQLGILILAIGCHLLNKQRVRKKYVQINNFFDYYLVFLVAVSPIMLLLGRFLFLLVPLMPILFIQTLDLYRKNKVVSVTIYGVLVLFVLAGIIMFLASVKAYPWMFDVKNIFFGFL